MEGGRPPPCSFSTPLGLLAESQRSGWLGEAALIPVGAGGSYRRDCNVKLSPWPYSSSLERQETLQDNTVQTSAYIRYEPHLMFSRYGWTPRLGPVLTQRFLPVLPCASMFPETNPWAAQTSGPHSHSESAFPLNYLTFQSVTRS